MNTTKLQARMAQHAAEQSLSDIVAPNALLEGEALVVAIRQRTGKTAEEVRLWLTSKSEIDQILIAAHIGGTL